MIFQKRFNELEDFHKYVTPFNEMYKFVVDNGENFNDVYDEFKKEHGLKNLYFSRLADLGYTDDRDVDVCYRISDLFLTYLDTNGILPEGVPLEIYTIHQYFFENDQEYQGFLKSMHEAMLHQEVKPEIVCGKKLYTFRAYIGLTERITLSDTVDASSCTIIERMPLTHKDLKNLNFK